MLGEAQGHLDLFAIADSTVEPPTVAQDAVGRLLTPPSRSGGSGVLRCVNSYG
jgi:hypothetical protein